MDNMVGHIENSSRELGHFLRKIHMEMLEVNDIVTD